ncbi:MAG: hypothetical protein G01um101431_261 [Parcubacteria group bacterium Gr01-1014_31]|nr:MAG: hypothetical protein G01um101431_261 [Parcubacteria group bacterium Gr01-1014_31]
MAAMRTAWLRVTNAIPRTRVKLWLAGRLYQLAKLVYRNDRIIIRRRGITYAIDLREAIDLSLTVFGSYQPHIARNRAVRLTEDAVIFDIGANTGVMSLAYAAQAPRGKVYAFEPTAFALQRLRKNIAVNPELEQRILVTQAFVAQSSAEVAPSKIYASWRVNGAVDTAAHPIHGGIAHSTDGVTTTTVDDFCARHGIQKIDLMKIDTDGHELQVLRGARQSIARFRPAVIFEMGLALMAENGAAFSDFFKYFHDLSYRLFDSRSNAPVDLNNYHQWIPRWGSFDALAIPQERLPRHHEPR